MSTPATIKIRCPKCQAKYRLPQTSMGHRAKCIKCQAVFRVPRSHHDSTIPGMTESGDPVSAPADHPSSTTGESAGGQRKSGHPTEEDILRWLNEGQSESDDDRAHLPRIIADPRPSRKQKKSETPNPTADVRDLHPSSRQEKEAGKSLEGAAERKTSRNPQNQHDDVLETQGHQIT